MSKYFVYFLFFVISYLLFSLPVFARITPDDIYQQRRVNFEANLAKISDHGKKQLVQQADWMLKDINTTVCNRFEKDLDRMAAILEEEKSRQGISNTIVAYGQGSTPLDSASYQLNYAAEALAYQKSQDYTPNIAGGNLAGAINGSLANLKYSLEILQGKILKAKVEVKKALDYYEK